MSKCLVFFSIRKTDYGRKSKFQKEKCLQHWMNVAFHDFSDRLENRCKDLSEREKDICYLSALGLDCENIAEILEVQPRSIERYISNICKKLGFEKGTKKLFVDFIGRWK